MKRVLRFIDEKFEEIIGVAVLGVVMTLIFIGVVMRLIFKSGLPWQEELSRILYVLMVYLGASYGMKSHDHIRITFVQNLLPPTGQRILRIATDVVWAAFNIIIVILSIGVYRKMTQFLGESAVLKIPLHVIFLIIPIGFTMLTLRLIQQYLQGKGGVIESYEEPAPTTPDGADERPDEDASSSSETASKEADERPDGDR